VTLLRGRRSGLEVVLAGRDLSEAFEELEARLGEQSGFYKGTPATVTFGATLPSESDLGRLRSILESAGIALRGLAGPAEISSLAQAHGLAYEADRSATSAAAERRQSFRPRGELKLSENARSLVADFAGARADIAQRRKRGEASVPRLTPVPRAPRETAPALHAVATPPGTLYHTQTLRGGQTLHHVGNIVVVGDVNPGAELVATGDILVFGRLAGVAHAGAQGDARARVYAIDLSATQLRIATMIATESETNARRGMPEVALIHEERIVVAPLDQLAQFESLSGASVS
jgi:septum site-determining protein MinC